MKNSERMKKINKKSLVQLVDFIKTDLFDKVGNTFYKIQKKVESNEEIEIELMELFIEDLKRNKNNLMTIEKYIGFKVETIIE
ncbi:hypothetical protein [Aliarcobacter butzleri]|uniref:hypothetical protein n=1 Tax=Aliarcobacter butzleri TaxID=28197 RepID=UPI002B240229|nr:hypothetical protein [Aliarcobacter butzleri]